MIQIRKTPRAILFGLALAVVLLAAWRAAPGWAEAAHHVAVPAQEITFQPGPPTLPAGAQVAVLLGSPAEAGPFVLRLKFPAFYEVSPHFHSKEEHLTVLKGRFGMSTGEVLDRTGIDLLLPGSFVRIPAGQPHFAWAEEETIVQINGVGPFDVNYVDEAEDPRIN